MADDVRENERRVTRVRVSESERETGRLVCLRRWSRHRPQSTPPHHRKQMCWNEKLYIIILLPFLRAPTLSLSLSPYIYIYILWWPNLIVIFMLFHNMLLDLAPRWADRQQMPSPSSSSSLSLISYPFKFNYGMLNKILATTTQFVQLPLSLFVVARPWCRPFVICCRFFFLFVTFCYFGFCVTFSAWVGSTRLGINGNGEKPDDSQILTIEEQCWHS